MAVIVVAEQPKPGPSQSGRDPLTDGLDFFVRRAQRRRDRIAAEIEANRRGEYRVPTWVLVVALVAMIAAIPVLFALT